jgi:hypothetical protein
LGRRRPLPYLATAGLALASVAALQAGASTDSVRVAVRLTDRGCTLAASARSRDVEFRVANEGHVRLAFAIAGRRIVVQPGRAARVAVEFPHAGTYGYRCSRRGHTDQRGSFRVVTSGGGPTAAAPCGTSPSRPTTYEHVVWIVMENKSFSDVIGSANAPNLNRLAHLCGLAANFRAEGHPSLPNYIAMTSGSTQGITNDGGPDSHKLNVDSIFQQVGDWRSLEESMPSPCSMSDTSDYAVRHNPAVYYLGLRATCAARDVPLGRTPDLSARFTFVTPNVCHDMHSSSCAGDTAGEIREGDAWLGPFLASVFETKQYRAGATAVFVTWDEDAGGDKNAGHVPTLVFAPSVKPGTVSNVQFDHYSLLRTTEELLGLHSFLGAAATAPSMRSAFGL